VSHISSINLLKKCLIFISIVTVISGEEISVLFNNTIILDNSTINWNNFNNETLCFLPQTTINFDQTSIITVETIIISTTIIDSNIDVSTSTTSQSTSLYTCADGSYGVNCNISSNICDITNPCLNGGTCYLNNTLSLGYFCQCKFGFSGYDCEDDNRICKDDTCW